MDQDVYIGEDFFHDAVATDDKRRAFRDGSTVVLGQCSVGSGYLFARVGQNIKVQLVLICKVRVGLHVV